MRQLFKIAINEYGGWVGEDLDRVVAEDARKRWAKFGCGQFAPGSACHAFFRLAFDTKLTGKQKFANSEYDRLDGLA
jgi:hypothetical protein